MVMHSTLNTGVTSVIHAATKVASVTVCYSEMCFSYSGMAGCGKTYTKQTRFRNPHTRTTYKLKTCTTLKHIL